ncbi:hypothetical protein B0H13DRAFT_2335079 [Mycena leptocephala]|nr:hypothetical protein B0H13DRAFT_2335079 [Mycena leptocephala]
MVLEGKGLTERRDAAMVEDVYINAAALRAEGRHGSALPTAGIRFSPASSSSAHTVQTVYHSPGTQSFWGAHQTPKNILLPIVNYLQCLALKAWVEKRPYLTLHARELAAKRLVIYLVPLTSNRCITLIVLIFWFQGPHAKGH